MSNSDLKRTPLYDEHIKLKARMVPFAGYEMPVQYSGVLEETRNVRSSLGLFDVSHMGQFRIRGNSALDALQKLVTNDLTKLQLGQAQYNLLCNPAGGVIDDIIVYRKAPNEIYICVNASNRHTDWNWMKQHLPKELSFADESDDTALLAIQGPKTEGFLSTLGDPQVIQGLRYYWATDCEIDGADCYLSRTGYTGEDGFELYVRNADAPKLWRSLLEKGTEYGIKPIGLGARDTLRLEMGYPLHGHELSQEISPLSAGLNWVVKLQKPEFIGKASLEKESREGFKQTLAAFIILDRRIARQDYKIFSKEKKLAGKITSGTQSPHRNAPIALGFIQTEFKNESDFLIEIRDSMVPAQKVQLPFVPSGVKRNVTK